MKLNYKRTILVGFAFFLISAFWQAYDAIVPLILTNHFGLPQSWSGVVMSLDNILAVFMLPLFGALSDRVGKRKPFIFLGTIGAVACFAVLTLVDNYQLARLSLTSIPSDMIVAGGNEAMISSVWEKTLELTLSQPLPLILFVGVLLLVLISMATFRSPAVALMPDVTVKPLRSKGNAIINLMGTAGGVIVLVLGIIFKTSKDKHMEFTGYVLCVCAIMILAFIVFMISVKEKKWAQEMNEISQRLGLDKEAAPVSDNKGVKLGKAEFRSLMLILASVALWYIGYNSISSKYSVYATTILGFDYNFTLIIAQATAILSYIPVGLVASRIGRKKTILAGIVMLTVAFFVGNFISSQTPSMVMYPVFALAGIGWATINVNSFPMVVELAKAGDVGKYTGYYYTSSMSAQIVAPILSGFLYTISMRIFFFSFATVFVALSFVTMLFVKHGDSVPQKRSALESIGADDD